MTNWQYWQDINIELRRASCLHAWTMVVTADSLFLFSLADGLEQCSHKDESPKLVIEAMRCAKQLLFTLHNISYGHGLSHELAETILDKYKLLTDTDYQGN